MNGIILSVYFVLLIQQVFSIRTAATKVVNFKLYISPDGRDAFLRKGRTIEESVEGAISKLEETLDTFMLHFGDPIKVKFKPTYATELPVGVDLDKCDRDIISISDMLNNFNRDDSLSSSIIIMSCNAYPYNDAFRVVGQKVPYITHSISALCTTRTVIFLETEEAKFLSVFTTALVRAAGINITNPLLYEEVIEGDRGVHYEIRVSSDTIESFKDNRCFYSA
uniref:Spore wall protein n=1 Tax=Antonospora locustae TaxID=278021 RepID=Q6E6F1_ANTLO|nr:hypothetical protein [Antonospora locustae]API85832.1 spore wall protein [Antonospora locustae]|eukprot:jgi/Antlo1/94/1753